MLRVAFYCGAFRKDFDGATKTIHKLIAYLQEKGVSIRVWSYEKEPETFVDVVKVNSLPILFAPGYRLALPEKRILQQIAGFAPDLIHLTVPDLVAMKIAIFAARKGIPVIASYHTDFLSYLKYFHLSIFKNFLERWLTKFYRQCSLVLAPSKYVADHLRSKGIKNVALWSRGIEIELFNPRFYSPALRWMIAGRERKIVLFVSRLVPYKGLKIMEKIYKLALAENLDKKLLFVICGDGPWREKLRRKMEKALFLGQINGQLLARLYASADLFIFPSDTEAFGNVVLEAQASGLPVIVADRGGCREIVEASGGGIICRANDAEDFFRALKKLINDEQLGTHLKEVALNFCQCLSWSEVNQVVLDHYLQIIEQKKGFAVQERLSSDKIVFKGDCSVFPES